MTDHCLKFRAGLALRFAGLELETQASGCLGLAVLQVLGFKFGGSHACDEQSGACKGAFFGASVYVCRCGCSFACACLMCMCLYVCVPVCM